MQIIIKKTHSEARIPTKAHETDAGFDLYAVGSYILTHGEEAEVKTGIKMHIPEGYAVLIWDKSSVAKRGIVTIGGVIDSGYRGEIIVIMKNLNHNLHHIRTGQKIAQFLLQKVEAPEIIEGEVDDKTDRGEKAFGSTGDF